MWRVLYSGQLPEFVHVPGKWPYVTEFDTPVKKSEYDLVLAESTIMKESGQFIVYPKYLKGI